MFWKRVKNRLFPEVAKTIYSQHGEDLILASIFAGLKIDKPSYLDIGAFHPKNLSNTYYFYRRGSRGVCVDANPDRCASFQSARPGDLCINVGVSTKEQGPIPFYVMSWEALSTFSEKEARDIEANGRVRIKKILQIPTISLSTLFLKYGLQTPDLLSIDIEGQELEVLQSMDWSAHRPKVLCVETITYSETNQERKQTQTIDWILAQGYKLYADTYINSIFVDLKVWEKR
jgi:FkbM family methyltransferase